MPLGALIVDSSPTVALDMSTTVIDAIEAPSARRGSERSPATMSGTVLSLSGSLSVLTYLTGPVAMAEVGASLVPKFVPPAKVPSPLPKYRRLAPNRRPAITSSLLSPLVSTSAMERVWLESPNSARSAKVPAPSLRYTRLLTPKLPATMSGLPSPLTSPMASEVTGLVPRSSAVGKRPVGRRRPGRRVWTRLGLDPSRTRVAGG